MEFWRALDQNTGILFDRWRQDSSSWLSEPMKDFTALGGRPVLALVVFFTVGLLLSFRRYRTALFVLVAAFGGLFLTEVVKNVVHRPRPANPQVAIVAIPHSPSFPSGHSSSAAVVYLTLALISTAVIRRWTVRAYVILASLVIVGLVGISRLYLGVHYLTDVLGGWCLGLVWALICRWIELRWVARAERRAVPLEAASAISE